MTPKKTIHFGIAALTSLVLGGCAMLERPDFPVSRQALSDLQTDALVVVRIDATTTPQFGPYRAPAPSAPPPPVGDTGYRVGVGDVISFTVWDHPELTTSAEGEGGPVLGSTVRRDGIFFFPYIGEVRARGRTLDEIREELTARLAEFIPDPQIDLQITRYASQKALVVGEILEPGGVTLTNEPITLIEAVDRRGGFSENADLERLSLERGGRTYRLDFRAYTEEGSRRQNPVMRDGDVLRIPRRKLLKAYLFGQVVEQGYVDLTRQDVSLTEALSERGGLQELRANARGIFLFRAMGDRTLVAQLDVSSPIAFLHGGEVYLHPDDVVYVTTAPIAQWNAVISNLLPSVAAVDTLQALQ